MLEATGLRWSWNLELEATVLKWSWNPAQEALGLGRSRNPCALLLNIYRYPKIVMSILCYFDVLFLPIEVAW